MISKSFEFTEPKESVLSEKSPFFISEESSPLSLIFRLLGGTCDLTNKNEDKLQKCINNFFYSDCRENENRSIDFLDKIEESIKINDYEKIIKQNKYKQVNFYKTLLNEISACIYYDNNEMYTTAFIHLYRCYESLSYAFPMIYAAKTETFYNTFENLKKWLCNSDSTGELKFHSNFISTLFEGTPELSSTIDINIKSKDEYKESLFNCIERKILGQNANTRNPNSVFPDKICIPFDLYHNLIVTLRNRYFHYMSSRIDNINLDEIIDPELLFSFVNKPSLYFISTIFNAIITHQYK